MTITAQVCHDGIQTYPSSGAASWKTMLAAGVLDGADADLTKPQDISDIATRIFAREHGRGSTIRARFKRNNDNGAVDTPPIVVLFGRFDSSEAWQILENFAGNTLVTMTTATADVDDGASDYTTPAINDHSWDTDGCNEFFFGVKTAHADAGTVTDSTLEVKMF